MRHQSITLTAGATRPGAAGGLFASVMQFCAAQRRSRPRNGLHGTERRVYRRVVEWWSITLDDEVDPDAGVVVELLDGIPEAYERARLGLAQATADSTLSLDEFVGRH
jgi:hypothetical protein